MQILTPLVYALVGGARGVEEFDVWIGASGACLEIVYVEGDVLEKISLVDDADIGVMVGFGVFEWFVVAFGCGGDDDADRRLTRPMRSPYSFDSATRVGQRSS